MPADQRNLFDRVNTGKTAHIEARRVPWLGEEALEIIHANMVTRVVYIGDTSYSAEITGPNGTRAKREEEAGFFDNIELTK